MATGARLKRREERVKLLAAALANVGTASFVAGFVAPAFGGRLGPFSLLLGFAFGLGFHALGQIVLEWVTIDDPEEERR